MHQVTRAKTLGGQQTQRLQQLQELSDDLIRRTHLQQPRLQPTLKPTSQPQASAASRTVEAVLEARQSGSGSTAARLRSKIEEARGSIRTERSERSERLYQQQAEQVANGGNQSHEPLVPPLVARKSTSAARRPTRAEAERRGLDEAQATAMSANKTTAVTRRTVGAVRRRRNPERESASEHSTKRKMSKDELEWVEKQLQFTQRIAVLERECESWWRQFYSASGAGSGLSSAAAAQIHKSFDDLATRRTEDAQQMKQQLHALRQKLRDVSKKLDHMRNGETFYADLQALIEELESSIAAFRLSQRERYDEYVMDEKVLEKELRAFDEKMGDWENEVSDSSAVSRDRGTCATGSAGRDRRGTERVARRMASSRTSSKALLQDETGDSRRKDEPVEEERGDSPERSTESDLMARVRRLDDLILQSGGMKGGWDDREHRVFTSLLLKYGLTDDVLLRNQRFQLKSVHASSLNQRNNDSSGDEDGDQTIDYEAAVARFLQRCIKQVVTKSNKAVRCHLIWYVDHVQLIQQKKDAISEWKTRKEHERQQIIHQGLVEEIITDAADSIGTSPIRHKSESVEDEKRLHVMSAKSKAKKEQLLLKWKEEKSKREKEQRRREVAIEREREAQEAKRKQELLDAKQKVLLYKLQKEQEATLADKSRSRLHSSPSPGSASPSASPASNEELMERSRQAIEYAKAKRAKLQKLEEKRQKQRELPKRPQLSGKHASSSPADGDTSPALLLQPTRASQAREMSKLELRKKDKERRRQNAHDAYISGAGAIPDVKLKSFGHIPIQPRAVPAWRRNI